jgi:hypothetical protein
MAPVAKSLPSKGKTLSSNSSTEKQQQKKTQGVFIHQQLII